ncbi:MBL fold metallo-hydrolase [Oleidesulfovibrio sp.]|uniref:MBL fold metallo-hydrolase n=1 Tax=Oleidesulfovibrio sp. TaxID=2909707 RepID=UPI003A881C77
MIVHALVDNRKAPDHPALSAEKGLSFHIRTAKNSIIFDMGCGRTFYDNAKLIEIDIEHADIAVISHRHHDHANGLPHFLHHNQHAKVFLRECEARSYVFKFLAVQLNIGFDSALPEHYRNRLIFINQTTEILPDVFAVINSSDRYPRPAGNQYLYSGNKEGLLPDTFEHELFLIIREPDGLVLFTGCAHAGVLNMIETVRTIFEGEKIKAVVGGFHLVGIPMLNGLECRKSDIIQLAKQLAQCPIDTFYTGHCTGVRAYRVLKTILGERINYIPTGSRINT